MNEPKLLKQIADLVERVTQLEADVAALKATPGVVTRDVPPDKPAPRRGKGAKHG